MNKLIASFLLILFSFNAKAESLEWHIGHAMMPFGFGVILTSFPVWIYYDRTEELDKKYESRKFKIKDPEILESCEYLKMYSTIDANKHDIYIGEELEGYSNIQQIKVINKLLNIKQPNKKEQYMCINPKKTKVFENGCLDTFKENKFTKVSGIWNINLLFNYDGVDYIQLKQNTDDNKYITATTEVTSINSIFKRNIYTQKCKEALDKGL
tara:strand:+ start:2119 stop:2751 length:633 start_codon:yes stop_codon:yes gene_type:complete